VSDEVVKVALPEFNATVLSVKVPSWNVTVPVAAAGETAAVKVTL
jgi:hypothetical protein